MVSFEIGKELRKMFSVLTRAWHKENMLSPHEELNLRPSDLWSEFFLCPTLVTRQKTSFLILYRAQNLPSLLFLSTNS